jgi:hypothetical protein
VTNVNLGKLLPPKWGINFPFNYAIGEETITQNTTLSRYKAKTAIG